MQIQAGLANNSVKPIQNTSTNGTGQKGAFTGVLTGILTGLLTRATPGGLTGGLTSNPLYLHGL